MTTAANVNGRLSDAEPVGITIREAVVQDEDLLAADESFLTSTTRKVVPIVRIDDRTISKGSPGSVTRALLAGDRRLAQTLTQTGVAAIEG